MATSHQYKPIWRTTGITFGRRLATALSFLMLPGASLRAGMVTTGEGGGDRDRDRAWRGAGERERERGVLVILVILEAFLCYIRTKIKNYCVARPGLRRNPAGLERPIASVRAIFAYRGCFLIEYTKSKYDLLAAKYATR